MAREAEIYYKDQLAGLLRETDAGYSFEYLTEYMESPNPQPVSLTLPIQKEPLKSNVLFPFFDGLIPEGWLLDVAMRNADVSVLDRMSLLLLCCKDCIGAVSVVERKEAQNV